MFHDVRLPEHIERGAEGGPRFKTSVIILTSGVEQRNIEWERARAEWDIGYSIQTKNQYSDVLKFFYARKGKAFGFRFKDYSDYKCTDEFLGEADDANLIFYLTKTYSDMGGNYSRVITRPITNTVQIYADGVLIPHTLGTGGKITLNVANLPSVGQPKVDITADFEFDVPVRFDVDQMRVNLDWEDAGDIPAINIVEIKEKR